MSKLPSVQLQKRGDYVDVKPPTEGFVGRLTVTELKAGGVRVSAGKAVADLPPPPPPDPDPEPPPPGNAPTNLQTALNAGGTVNATGGSYSGTFTISKPLTLIGGKVTGRILIRNTSDVTIDGTEVTGSQANPQQGAIDAENVDLVTVRRVKVHDNKGAGISIRKGIGHLVEDSEFYRNQQQGFHFSEADDVTFRRNRIHENNTGGAPLPRIDAGWEAGGGKMSWARGALFEDNESWNNGGPGIWFDLDNRNITVRRNRSHHNRIGIFYEISHEAVIEDNVCYENGWPGDGNAYSGGSDIRVSSSRLVTVRRNLCAHSRRGINFLAQNRSDGMLPGHERPSTYEGCRSEDNVVIGAGQDNLHGFFRADGKRLDVAGNGSAGDRFWQPNAEPQSNRFEWASSGKPTLSAYAATPGGSGARYLTTTERNDLLTAAGVPLGRS